MRLLKLSQAVVCVCFGMMVALFPSCDRVLKIACAQVVPLNGPGPIAGCNANFVNNSNSSTSSSIGTTGVAAIQKLNLTIAAASTSATQNVSVVNSAFVRITPNGWNGGGTGTTCTSTSDFSGVASTQPCNSVEIIPSIVNGTTIQILASRQSAGTGTQGTQVDMSIADLNPAFVDNVQWGTINTGSTATYTACPGGFLRTELTWLGSSGLCQNTALNLQNGTTVSNFSTGCAAALAAEWQVVCYK